MTARAGRTYTLLLGIGVAGVEQYIKSIGLFRTKAKNVVALSQILLEKHGGAVPLQLGPSPLQPGLNALLDD